MTILSFLSSLKSRLLYFKSHTLHFPSKSYSINYTFLHLIFKLSYSPYFINVQKSIGKNLTKHSITINTFSQVIGPFLEKVINIVIPPDLITSAYHLLSPKTYSFTHKFLEKSSRQYSFLACIIQQLSSL